MIINLKQSLQKSGSTLVETVLYTAIFAIIATILIAIMANIIQIWSQAKAQADIVQNGENAMDNMLYNIRAAKALYPPTTVSNAPNGQLSILTDLNPPQGETDSFVDFYIDNGVLYEKQELINPIPLTSSSVSVTSFQIQTLSSTSTPQGVSMSLTLSSNSAPSMQETFYAAAAWRNNE